ncbi:hypothetical protein [Zoogloea sp. LCSB751]|uniref:hypothetical protein n=1 Tax=Zoogloea sp. LCSB751 TaxID=1965277 RepID=UPI0009A497D5|nr:hypothetical protein [Zoogloea sp. LCSB751]
MTSDDSVLWGGVIVALAVFNAGALIYRSARDEDFKVGLFDLLSNGVLVFFILAARDGWHVVSTVALVVVGSALVTVLSRVRWMALINRADARDKRIALLCFPFLVAVSVDSLIRDLDGYSWAPSLFFLVTAMAAILCLLWAITGLSDWLRGP